MVISPSSASLNTRYKILATRYSRAFTLVETMIVAGMIVILSAILIGYSSQGSKQLILASSEAKILSLVSRAKFLSVETFFAGQSEGETQICAYGVKVDRSGGEIFIFQDRASECPADDRYDSESDLRLGGEINEVILEPTVMRMTDATTLDNLVFIPPDPDVKINNGAASASVVVELTDGSGDFTVTVNNVGQVKTE